MAWKWLGLCLMVLFVEGASTIGLKGEKHENLVFKCVENELCTCKAYSKFQMCYDKLLPKTKTFFLEKINECNIAEEVTVNDIRTIAKRGCGLDRKLMAWCYEKLYDDFRSYMMALGEERTPEALEEASLVEQSRICLTPNFAKCSGYGLFCL